METCIHDSVGRWYAERDSLPLRIMRKVRCCRRRDRRQARLHRTFALIGWSAIVDFILLLCYTFYKVVEEPVLFHDPTRLSLCRIQEDGQPSVSEIAASCWIRGRRFLLFSYLNT